MRKDQLKKIKLPDCPGAYIFRDENKKILYIGKAASLRDRVRSYFAHDLAETRSPAIAGMIAKIKSIDWEETESVLEALILEANLIKRHQPPYNVDEKDNKSFNYLVITKEDFPRVLIVRGRELFHNFGFRKSKFGFTKPKYVFGPFPQGGSLKEALKLVRKIFPFRDRCMPCQGDTLTCRPCFNRQIGLCPGVCSGEMNGKEYKEVIRNIVELFGGGMRSLKRRLEKEMKAAAEAENFEKAEGLRRQVRALTHIRDVSLIKDEYRVAPGGSFRIEAYDVAHTAGVETVGVMTVVTNGELCKEGYRMFKIRGVKNDDTKALAEVLERRLSHTEWAYPKLIVVDGGKAQLRSAERVLAKAGVIIPVVGVVKNEFHRPERVIGDERFIRPYEKDIVLANSEAHRFAISFHRRRQRKQML